MVKCLVCFKRSWQGITKYIRHSPLYVFESIIYLQVSTISSRTRCTWWGVQLLNFEMPWHDSLQHTRFYTMYYCLEARLQFELPRYSTIQLLPGSSPGDFQCAKHFLRAFCGRSAAMHSPLLFCDLEKRHFRMKNRFWRTPQTCFRNLDDFKRWFAPQKQATLIFETLNLRLERTLSERYSGHFIPLSHTLARSIW